ncbi:hypothetical protein GCM10009551_013990 [Nocardiopsis tropica]
MLIAWEGWAAAPLGYDAAVLHAYALAEPGAAAVIREVFSDVLDTEEGRLAHLIVCAEIVQAGERNPLHRRLAPYTRAFAHDLLAACSLLSGDCLDRPHAHRFQERGDRVWPRPDGSGPEGRVPCSSPNAAGPAPA